MVASLSDHLIISKKIKNVMHVYQVHAEYYNKDCKLVKRTLLSTYLNKNTAIKDLNGILKSKESLYIKDCIQSEYHDLDNTLDNFQVFCGGKIHESFGISNVSINCD